MLFPDQLLQIMIGHWFFSSKLTWRSGLARLQISGGARNNLANRQRLLLDALAGFRARTCYWSCLPKGIACLNRRRCAKCRSLLNI